MTDFSLEKMKPEDNEMITLKFSKGEKKRSIEHFIPSSFYKNKSKQAFTELQKVKYVHFRRPGTSKMLMEVIYNKENDSRYKPVFMGFS